MTNKTLKIKKLSKSSFTKKASNGRKYNYKNDKTKRGGNPTHFITVSNNGSVIENGEEMKNQCFWISLRDYFNNFGCRTGVTVRSLKTLARIRPETEEEMNGEVDLRVKEYKHAAELLANLLDIQIAIYLIDTDSTSILKDREGNPAPDLIFNEKSANIVPIAHFGDHFELIIKAPGINLTDNCPTPDMIRLFDKHRIGTTRDSSTPSEELSIGEYQPHILLNDIFVSFEFIQRQMRTLIGVYNDNMREIIRLRSQIEKIDKQIAGTILSKTNLNRNLNSQNITDMNAMYDSERAELENKKRPLEGEMKDKEAINLLINELINLKKRYVELMHNQSHLQSNIASIRRHIIENETGLAEINSSGLNEVSRGHLREMYRNTLREKTTTLPRYEELLRENIATTNEIKDVIERFEAEEDFKRLLTQVRL